MVVATPEEQLVERETDVEQEETGEDLEVDQDVTEQMQEDLSLNDEDEDEDEDLGYLDKRDDVLGSNGDHSRT